VTCITRVALLNDLHYSISHSDAAVCETATPEVKIKM
jgi:hypothetical protein